MIITRLLFLLFVTLGGVRAHCENYAVDEIEIWPDSAPLNKPVITLDETLDEEQKRFRQISVPSIFLFRKSDVRKPGPALLYIPGGGYANVSIGRDRGKEWANLFFSMGFTTVAVLKYRLPDTRIVEHQHKVPLLDAQQALATLHRNASSWQIDREKIGVMGASAGGHLAASLSNLSGEILAPGILPEELAHSFSILRVPVITFTDPYRHEGSYHRLLGDRASDKDLMHLFSLEHQVTSRTPPTFLVYATDDTSVPYQNSLLYASQIEKHGVPVTTVQLERGGHTFGLDRKVVDKDWTLDLRKWVQQTVHDN
ncbi:alpha/beta hydrolase [Microbulbifer sp. HZ11]|uniref:alpha/beta hydrolase n=1 Tax=Microbulbifer sp. HZ11 TaxID=1453501 RepID=UPI0006908439|nr:alpha/beta hydrolase [Microbulbifer sp. HZ11]